MVTKWGLLILGGHLFGLSPYTDQANMERGHMPEFYIPKMLLWMSMKSGLEITDKGLEQTSFKGSHNKVPSARSLQKQRKAGVQGTCPAQG